MFARLKALTAPYTRAERLERELAEANDLIAQQSLHIQQLLRHQEEGAPLPSSHNNGGGAISPENVVWIFGAARTGSTWLSRMMGELKGHYVWNEPLVGSLFGNLYYTRAKHLIGRGGKHYILGDAYRGSWMNSMREFILKEAVGRFPKAAGPSNHLVIKEPNGSLGAPLLMEALPKSRMILLVRDPRDVVASSIDARSEGGWKYDKRDRRQKNLAGANLEAFVKKRAAFYLQGIEKPKQAYDAHQGPKVLVRYEDLKADALGSLRRIYSALEIPTEEGELSLAVDKHSWKNVPQDKKGEGKIYRKATPGGWRGDLTPEQARIVEEVTRPLLEEFYP